MLSSWIRAGSEAGGPMIRASRDKRRCKSFAMERLIRNSGGMTLLESYFIAAACKLIGAEVIQLVFSE
jgi:hypothetical protein